MKKFNSFISLSLLLFCLCAASIANAETITLRADTWFPFNGEPGTAPEGYMIEIARKIFKEQSIEIDYQLTPWSRSIREAESGQVDGIIGATKGDAPTFIYPEEPLGRIHNTFFALRESAWSFSGVDSLGKITLGYIIDYSYGATLDPYIKSKPNNDTSLQGVGGDNALEQNIKKLKLKRIDVLIETPEVFYYTVKKLGLKAEDFREAGEAAEKDPLFIAFSPVKENSKRYAKVLSDGVRELRKSGELQKILDRYDIKDWAG